MILSVTLNPVLDTTYFIEGFRPVYRTEAHEVRHLAGGKGNNVARALKELGVAARSLTTLGGLAGKRAATLLHDEGIDAVAAWMSGETRHQITVVNRAGEQRAFFPPSAPFTDADVNEVRGRLGEALEGATGVCLCGSSPGALADGLFAEILRLAAARGIPALLDSSGAGLRRGLEATPTVVKVNRAEAAGLLERELDGPAGEIGALDMLLESGARWAVLTLEERGALFAAGTRKWSACPPQVAVVNTIGCGDAMTAGLMAGMLSGQRPEACFRLGMAAAAANTLSWDTGQLEAAEVERLVGQIEVVEL